MVTHTGGHHRDSHGSDSSPFEQGATTPGARTGSTSPVVFTPRTSPKSSPVVLTPSSSADDFFNYHLQATQQSEPNDRLTRENRNFGTTNLHKLPKHNLLRKVFTTPEQVSSDLAAMAPMFSGAVININLLAYF
ncbi:hypothetical protein C6P46_002897 [Rhodotorula mucilaginosa]|uniref:Uncharacterized protein n=1 Tax=Rhodotorula mucilaginosa TaxID=5537 RepID=A0A9P6W3V6_RHOMI|nr:hypothetical protein C6P46_002897 [Rhodotorula mucilaginosa]